MRLEIDIEEGPEYMSADEIAVHSILNGYHLPKIDYKKIHDKLISDSYSGKLGPMDEVEVGFAMMLITAMANAKEVDKP